MALAVSLLVVGCSASGASQESLDEQNAVTVTAPTVNQQNDHVASQLLELSERLASMEQQLQAVESRNLELAGSKQPSRANVAQAPQYSPTPEDFKALAFDRVEAAYGNNIRFFSFSGRYSPYASVYIATACVSGSDTSFDGFREFLDQTLLMVRRTDKVPIINVSGEEAISQIISTANRIPNLGPSSEMSDCMRRYLYPASYSDAAPAIELVKSFKNFDRISPDFKDSYKKVLDERVIRLFGAWENQSRPFLLWLCEQLEEGAFLSCRIEVEVEVVKQFQPPQP